MTAILEFFAGLLEGCRLIALALSVGGLAYPLLVLRPAVPDLAIREAALARSLRVTAAAAGVLACARLAQLVLKGLALSEILGLTGWSAFVRTEVFQFGAVSVLLATGLALAVRWLRRDPFRPVRWATALGLALAFLVNEAWLSHAASRLAHSGALMTLTVLHVAGATAWAGSIAHLLLFRRLIRHRPEARRWWPPLVARFSLLGQLSVGILLGAGVILAFSYVGTPSGLLGTGYGNMLGAKVVLFIFVLVLAALNFRAARRWQTAGQIGSLQETVPAYIEVEAFMAVALFFMAAALTSFPPAVDVPEDTATAAEVAVMFLPKEPQLGGPQIALIDDPALTDPATGLVGTREEPMWDRFNHNISGVIVLAMAGLAWLDRARVVSWARHWPFLFIGFSVLIGVFANPDDWPLGSRPIVASVQRPEAIQHWLAALVVFALGWFEWRARRVEAGGGMLPYVFPVLSMAGGLVLLTHSHQIAELKQEFLTQSTHVAMGLLAVVMGCARWLELRLPSPRDRAPGYVAVAAMTLIGLVLLFYVSPGVVYLRNLW